MGTEHLAVLDLVDRSDATHVAISDGDWSDPLTWYQGRVPSDDARVLIPDGIEVSYGVVSDARLFTVRVDGTLDFATDTDSRMVFDTVVVSPIGHLIVGDASDPVDSDTTVELIVANNGPIDTGWDPLLLSRGIISHGETKIHGSEKDSHEKVIEDPMAGDTSIRFADIPEGWQVGDKIVIAGTHYESHESGPEDEVRVITEIGNNGMVFFDEPLVHDHDSPRTDLKTSVANYTRNVTVKTENAEDAEVYERGHVMFMHSNDVDVRYAAFHELGRTDKSFDSRQADDFKNIQFDSNVQGRYSLHVHRAGVEDLDDPALLVGNAVFGSPGWGFVHHDSHAILENNASYDTFGAGYVAETGNETGVWSDNIAIFAEGNSWSAAKGASELGSDIFDTARGGNGFWFQGRLVGASDNVAASVNEGFVYFHRDGDSRMINFDSHLFEFPAALYFDDDVGANVPSIRQFENNETFAAKDGLVIIKGNPRQGHDVASELKDFTAWNVQGGAHLQYTAHYILENFDIVGSNDAEIGIDFGNNVFDITIDGAQIDGFETGINLNKSSAGNLDLPIDEHHYVVIDVDFFNVETDFENYDASLDQLLTSDDVTEITPDLSIDGQLTYAEGSDARVVEIEGTKTDGFGEINFPSGRDDFDLDKDDVINILETTGYWTTDEAQAYTLIDLYFTDRVTGDIYYETHPIYFDENVPLGDTSKIYGSAINNGTQKIFEIYGKKGMLFRLNRRNKKPTQVDSNERNNGF